MAEFRYEDMLPIGKDETPYRLLTTEGVEVVEGPGGRTFLQVAPEALTLLAETAMHDIAHYLRPAHLQQLRNIMDDEEASPGLYCVAVPVTDIVGEPARLAVSVTLLTNDVPDIDLPTLLTGLRELASGFGDPLRGRT